MAQEPKAWDSFTASITPSIPKVLSENSKRNYELELLVENWLKQCGYQLYSGHLKDLPVHGEPGDGVYLKQIEIDKNIYGENKPIDFLMYLPQHLHQTKPLLRSLECKWPARSGVIEENPLLALPIKVDHCYTMIILPTGALKNFKLWAKEQREKNSSVRVISWGDGTEQKWCIQNNIRRKLNF